MHHARPPAPTRAPTHLTGARPVGGAGTVDPAVRDAWEAEYRAGRYRGEPPGSAPFVAPGATCA